MLNELMYGNTRTYLIKGSKGILLIDTDWAGTLPQFFKAIKTLSVQIEDISHLLITHYHPDHMGLAQDLVDLGVQLVIMDVQKAFTHQSDLIFEKEDNRDFKPIDDDAIFLLSCADSRAFLAGLGIVGEIVHTPGHSEDSVSVVLDSGQAIVGDLCPLVQVPLYDDPVLTESWNALLSHQLKTVYYAHPLPDNVGRWQSFEEYKADVE